MRILDQFVILAYGETLNVDLWNIVFEDQIRALRFIEQRFQREFVKVKAVFKQALVELGLGLVWAISHLFKHMVAVEVDFACSHVACRDFKLVDKVFGQSVIIEYSTVEVAANSFQQLLKLLSICPGVLPR